MQYKLKILIVLTLAFCLNLACSTSDAQEIKIKTTTSSLRTEKLESYTLRGNKFSYYKIPNGLPKEDLIKTARTIHAAEPEANLILVDDTTQVDEYIKYAQAFGKNDFNAELPKEWADKHIIANVQKLVSGKWQLCEGYGYREIADLE
jgi:hypothetical protein